MFFSPTAPEPEPRLTVKDYERTYDQNEAFGLNDMKTENYDELDIGNSGLGKTADGHSGDMQDTMRNLQSGGKEAHPHENLVGKPDL